MLIHASAYRPKRLEINNINCTIFVCVSRPNRAQIFNRVIGFKVLLQKVAVPGKECVQNVLRTVSDVNLLVDHTVDIESLVLVYKDTQSKKISSFLLKLGLNNWILRQLNLPIRGSSLKPTKTLYLLRKVLIQVHDGRPPCALRLRKLIDTC